MSPNLKTEILPIEECVCLNPSAPKRGGDSFQLKNREFGPWVATLAIIFAGNAPRELGKTIYGRTFDMRVGMAIGRAHRMANENFRSSGFRLWLLNGRLMKKEPLLPDGPLKLTESW
tara:strand:- start:172 stop:522 length:351 start_codon:yes stop_codon:yes gene_type:complete